MAVNIVEVHVNLRCNRTGYIDIYEKVIFMQLVQRIRCVKSLKHIPDITSEKLLKDQLYKLLYSIITHPNLNKRKIVKERITAQVADKNDKYFIPKTEITSSRRNGSGVNLTAYITGVSTEIIFTCVARNENNKGKRKR